MFRRDTRKPHRLLLIAIAASLGAHLALALLFADLGIDQPGTPPDDREQVPLVETMVEEVEAETKS